MPSPHQILLQFLVAPSQFTHTLVNLLILLLHFLPVLMQFRHLLLQLPRSLLLLTESLHVLLLLAADDHADFNDIVVDLTVARVFLELLQEEKDSLFVKLLI